MRISRVADQIGQAKIAHAGLAGAEKFSRAAQAQIGLGDFEAVVFSFHHPQSLRRQRILRRAIDEQAGARRAAAPHPAAQLMQLR